MKNKINENIFLISAIDCIVNEKTYNKIDLGNYYLKYMMKEEERATLTSEEGGIPSLMFQIKLINKTTNKIEWADIFYKSLKKYKFDDVFNLSVSEKKSFIFKSEGFISRKKFSTSAFVIPTKFFADIPTRLDSFDYPNIVMPNTITNVAQKELLQYLQVLLSELNQKMEKIQVSPKK